MQLNSCSATKACLYKIKLHRRPENHAYNKAKVAPKTVQGILRHSRIQTTLDLYTRQDGDETRAAQGAFLKALRMPTNGVQ